MKVAAYLRDTRDGFSKIYYPDYDYETEEHAVFMWVAGNFGCDCNRSLFLYDWMEDKELECSLTDNIIVLDKLVDIETGRNLI